eukprot:TRINITY_DN79245_c0_g1_i1.p1 TRINITY_DN79245_c0_g1~~TRINITY_DN79245_c0_g1_i1.p1  ORF type:complete len:241 (+),score=39.62 TRINITY_DN79245_c0_g1_i1:15-737(+)
MRHPHPSLLTAMLWHTLMLLGSAQPVESVCNRAALCGKEAARPNHSSRLHRRIFQSSRFYPGRARRLALSDQELAQRVAKSDFDWSFYLQPDPSKLATFALFSILVLPLVARLLLATRKREARLRASVKAKSLKERMEDAPGDMKLLKLLRIEENAAKTLQAEEDELREIRLLGRPVVQFGLLDTSEIQELKNELRGNQEPKVSRNLLFDFILLSQMFSLVIYSCFLLIQDPMAGMPDMS